MSTPTREFYDVLQRAFDFFNERLFAAALPPCLITAQREKNTMGYFSPERWASSEGRRAHEIALNPAYFADHPMIEIFQTLVHEQCHLWQFEFGRKKSRRGYHNREWAEKMQSLGLMPSHNGEPGGRITGQKMSDYPVEGGPFLEACQAFMADFRLPWVDRHAAVAPPCQSRPKIASPQDDALYTRASTVIPDLEPLEERQQVVRARQKVRYQCEGCHAKLWGKPGLNVICGTCNLPYQGDPP